MFINETSQSMANSLKDRLGLDAAPKMINPDAMLSVFGSGVLATVRVTSKRFAFSVKIEDLGLVPLATKRQDKVVAAINSILSGSQRASLLPKDALTIVDPTNGSLKTMATPEQTERRVRFLFPTRYENGSLPDNPTASSWHAVPLNGMTFIPLSAWDEWNKQFEAAKAAHLACADQIIENYDRLKAASIRHWMQIGLDVYRRLEITAPDRLAYQSLECVDGEYVTVSKTTTPLEWCRRWKKIILASWPTRGQIKVAFSVEAKFFFAPMPSEIVKDRIVAEEQYNAYINKRDAYNSLIDRVRETQQSQVHELTVAYVKTIVERSEMVFLGFLNFAKNGNRNVSARQLNSVLRVADMIKTMSEGVSSLEKIEEQAKSIETYIKENKSALTQQGSRKGGIKQTAADTDLPEIIAHALQVVRQEAESLIGLEARRTAFSDEDPSLMFVASEEDGVQARRYAASDTSTAPDISAFMTAGVPSGVQNEDEMASVRR